MPQTLRRTLLALSAFCSSTFAFADDWSQWRGPKNDGHSTEKNIATEWSADKNIVWKLDLPGQGSSTPCIWGDKIFISCMNEKSEAQLMCIGTDGKQKWAVTLGQGNVKSKGDEGGNLATGSCSTDGKYVYALIGSGQLVAFDFAGKEIWRHDLAKAFGDYSQSNVIQFGGHWTPVLHQGRLYVTIMHRLAQKILAYEAETGKKLWEVDRKSDAPKGVESYDVYSSPFIWSKGEQAQLIVHGTDYCTGHQLENGEEIWRVTELNPKGDKYNRFWRSISSPLATPDLLVVPSCKRGVTVAIDPATAKGETKPGDSNEKWRIPKNTPDVSSPIMHEGILYLMGENGRLMAHEASDGKLLYEENITNMRHRANPVLADGKLYFLGRDGVCVVVKAGKEFNKIATNKLPDTFTASPAISNGVLYLRGWKALYAVKTQ